VETRPKAKWSFIEEDNIATLVRMGGTIHLGHLSYRDSLAPEQLLPLGLQMVDLLG